MKELPSKDQLLLDRIIDAIEINLEDENFGVSDLAHELGLSRSQLHRKIHSLTGKPASQVIREHRLKKGKELLENEASSIAEISYTVGFCSPSYFTACFSALYGYPPSEVKLRKVLGYKKPIKSKWSHISMTFLGIFGRKV